MKDNLMKKTNIVEKYTNKVCDYGWGEDDNFVGTILPKKSIDGQSLMCGQYVRNKFVSGKIVFYSTSCCFRVKVIECRYKKDLSSIDFFYPTPLGREEQTNWEIYDNKEDLSSWLKYFPSYHDSKQVEEKD
jgi:hypothetical protein